MVNVIWLRSIQHAIIHDFIASIYSDERLYCNLPVDIHIFILFLLLHFSQQLEFLFFIKASFFLNLFIRSEWWRTPIHIESSYTVIIAKVKVNKYSNWECLKIYNTKDRKKEKYLSQQQFHWVKESKWCHWIKMSEKA